MTTCTACAIANKSINSHIVFENSNIICFLDHCPINQGHVLICPRQHYPNISDLPDDVLSDIARVAKRMATVLSQTFKCDGVSLLQNNGAFNDLNHFHLHIFPRVTGNGFGWTVPSTSKANSKGLAGIWTMLTQQNELLDQLKTDMV